MSEERKPVICSCGEEMHFVVIDRETHCGEAPWFGYYTCACGWMAPSREGDTTEDCERNAYLAATRRPPNRPLTLEQVEAMDDLDAVWCCYPDGKPRMNAYPTTVRWAKTYGTLCEFPYMTFGRLPTPADIAAARAGKGEGNAD